MESEIGVARLNREIGVTRVQFQHCVLDGNQIIIIYDKVHGVGNWCGALEPGNWCDPRVVPAALCSRRELDYCYLG